MYFKKKKINLDKPTIQKNIYNLLFLYVKMIDNAYEVSKLDIFESFIQIPKGFTTQCGPQPRQLMICIKIVHNKNKNKKFFFL